MKMQFKLKALAAVGMMMMVGTASAAVVGGGATLPEELYGNAKADGSVNTGILNKAPNPGFNAYVGVGSGNGKKAFFDNNSDLFLVGNAKYYPTKVTVDYAGSDSLVSQDELNKYNASSASTFGPLIQIPAVLTSVTVPYNVSGNSTLNLTSAQLTQIFSGAITNWSDVGGPDQTIKVVYRADESGTTEIFLRHLNAVSPTAVTSVNKDFSKVINVSNAARYVAATGSDGVVNAVNSTPYSIGYVSPDKVEYSNPAKVASINGLLPTEVNVQAVVGTVTLPTSAADKGNPLKWGISQANPSQGYPIVASTNLIFSQCYQNTDDTARIRAFLNEHYGTTGNTAAIQTHGFVPLPNNWKLAVRNTFANTSSDLSIGYDNICNGKGRPQ